VRRSRSGYAKWPLDKLTLVEAWSAVHTRFGFAAREGTDLETGLVMIISQTQCDLGSSLSFESLLQQLEANGSLSLGRLVTQFGQLHQVPDNLKGALGVAVSRRNYLIHHFYRRRASAFHTPEGCEQMQAELVEIQDSLAEAIELLKEWKKATFGGLDGDDLWDEINRDFEKWKQEEEAMQKAILGVKNAI